MTCSRTRFPPEPPVALNSWLLKRSREKGMRKMRNKTLLGFTGVLAAGALALAGCSDSPSSTTENGDAAGADSAAGDQKVVIGMFNWDEDIAVSHLWKNILEEKGYEVQLETADPGPVFQGMADGDYDLVLDVWLPLTHQSYIERYGDDIVELAAWNNEAKLTIATNADSPVNSLEELAENADLYGNKLIGIEAGAGLTLTTEDVVIPAYGLEKMDFVISSTPAMLTELSTAMSKDEDVVVTLWKPHWAYDAYDIKDLEDPDHALGEAESIFVYAHKDFPEKNPEVTGWMQDFRMDTEKLHSLENVMFNENEDPDKYEEIVAQWMADNREYVDSLTD